MSLCGDVGSWVIVLRLEKQGLRMEFHQRV